MRTKIFAILDKMKPGTPNIKALNLEAVKISTVQATELTFKEKLSKNILWLWVKGEDHEILCYLC
jgi:hypothetical protein